MKKYLLLYGTLAALLCVTAQALASHLKIGPALIKMADAKEGTVDVRFDLSWDDAWKNDINCDGAWVFAKFRVGDGNWHHVSLKSASVGDFDGTDQSPTGFSRGSANVISETGLWVPKSRKGFFVFRTHGQGPVRLGKAVFPWDYRKDEVKEGDLEKAEIRIFGIEMVYVPQGSFYLGDPQGPNGSENCFYTYPDKGAYLVTSEKEITVDAKEGFLYCDKDQPHPDNSRDDVPFVIPEKFPKGFNAFWCMKYELNTRNYVDFLNTLTRRQQQARVSSDISGDQIENYYVMTNTKVETQRQSIVCQKSGNGTNGPVTFHTSAPERACNMLSWVDVAAYGDWAALRPISELEFEKACRGTAQPVPGEYAWGTTRIGRVDAFDGADGSGDETKIPVTGLVNCAYEGGIAPYHKAEWKEPKNPGFEGPVSNGLFAQSRNANVPVRENDGATFYGIMEMSGNLWEPIVTVGNPRGRTYTGECGDGALSPDGTADVKGWPDSTAVGAGMRGATWESDPKYLTLAIREVANFPRPVRGTKSGCRLGSDVSERETLAQNKILPPATALPAVSGSTFPGLKLDWLDGLHVTVGLTHVAESNSRIDGVHNREGSKGSIQTQSFNPQRKIGFSLAAEYLLSMGNGLLLGPGIQYNFANSLERDYGNNKLSRRISAQTEVYDNFSNMPVYLSMQYNFSTVSFAKPFLFGRIGYSYNRMGSYSMTLYEEGLLPIVQPPVEAGGSMVTRTSDVRDLDASPYVAVGMGVRFKERFSLQAMYSYTSVRFRVFYPTRYTYYSSMTQPPSYTTESFQVIEAHQMDYSQVQLSVGYSFGPRTDSPEAAGIDREREWDWSRGFNLMVGLNKNLPLTSTLTHINTTVVNRYGEVARSVQDVVLRPVKPLSATAGLEYLYPVFRQLDVGVGVLHDFSRSYEKVQTSATGGYTQIRIENFTNTAPYVVGRYHFQTVSVLEPYFIGRLGYSFNKFDYNKYNNETTMVGVSASDIKNRLCAALGMGSRLSRHLLAELTYDVLWTGHDKPAYNGDSEEFSTTLQGIRLNVGYNF